LYALHSYVPSLLWQVRLYQFILLCDYFHAPILALFFIFNSSLSFKK
jgi:hypothetical protein